MDRIQIPAALERVSTLKDGGLSLGFHTQELKDEEKVRVMQYLNEFGWILFATQEHDEDTELEAIRRDVGGKSPSQRLRAVLYIAYKQGGRDDLTFEQYYARQMEKLIDGIKQKLS